MSIAHRADVVLDVQLSFSRGTTSVAATLYTATATGSFTASVTSVSLATVNTTTVQATVVVSALADGTRFYVSATDTGTTTETQRSAVRYIDASIASRLAPTIAGRTLAVDASGNAPATIATGAIADLPASFVATVLKKLSILARRGSAK